MLFLVSNPTSILYLTESFLLSFCFFSQVDAMPYGGVTVDLAAASGGNVETTSPGEFRFIATYCNLNQCFVELL